MVNLRFWERWTKPSTTIKERFKAGIDVAGHKPKARRFYVGEHSWGASCRKFEQMTQAYPLLKQGLLTLAGLVLPEGAYTSPAEKKPVKKSEQQKLSEADSKTYALAEEAQWRVEKFNEDMRVNNVLYNTVYIMCKFGSCFWELTEEPKFAYRIIPNQESMEPAAVDDIGNITGWRQVIQGSVVAEWPAESIVHFAWNVSSSSWPYGTPFLIGLDVETESMLALEKSSADFMDKNAWPYEVLSVGDSASPISASDYAGVKSSWGNRQPGDGFTLRNIPVNLMKGGTGDTPLRELSDLMNLMKDNIQDGLMVPAISKLYNSTEASAKVMTSHIMTVLGQPIQWLIKEKYEEQVIKPYCESIGFSRKSAPKLIFESPTSHKAEEAEFWKVMGELQVQSPEQIAEHLGLEFDEDYWKAKKEEEQAQFEQQQKMGLNKPGANGEQKPEKPEEKKPGVEEWVVKRLTDHVPD